MKLYAEVDDKDRKLKTLYGIVEYMDGTRLVCDKFYAVKEQEPKPKTIQEIQAESEKYQKAFEDGYEQGYAQARFDYEQEPCEDDINRHDVECIVEELENICHNAPQEVLELLAKLKNAPFATPYPKAGHWVEENVNGGGRRVFCSECGCPPPFEHISTGDVYSASGYGVINKTKFCPNCGIKMEREET